MHSLHQHHLKVILNLEVSEELNIGPSRVLHIYHLGTLSPTWGKPNQTMPFNTKVKVRQDETYKLLT